MSDKTNSTKRSRKKAALAGQQKAQLGTGAQQKAVESVAGAMGNLNALFAQQNSDTAPTTAGATSSDATPVAQEESRATTVTTEVPPEPKDEQLKDVEASAETSVTLDDSVSQKESVVAEAVESKEPSSPSNVEVPSADQAETVAVEPSKVEDNAARALQSNDHGLPTPLSKEGMKYAANVEEIHQELASAEGAMYLVVNVKDVYGSKGNHRKFGISFEKYLELLPPLPDNWEQLTGITYVDQVWSDIIIELSDNGDIDDAQARKMRETLIDIFDLGYSIQNKGQIHSPLGYLVYDDNTGRPLRVELVSGEKRMRSHYMFGRKTVVMQFTENSTAIKPSALEEYSRKELRLAENTKSKKPDDSEVLEGIRDLHEAHKNVEGAAKVEEMSDAELVRKYTSALPCTEANLAALEDGKDVPRQLRRWVSIARHSQAAAFQRIMRMTPASIKRMEPLRTAANKYASELDVKLSPELVYAIALEDDDLDFSPDYVPEVLREKVLAMRESLRTLSSSASHGEEEDDLPDTLLGERAGNAKRRAARMARDSRTALGVYGTTVMKGKNAAESRQYAFAQIFSMTVLVKGGLDQADTERMHRLNALRGEAISDDKLIEYRQLLLEGYKAIEDALNTMTSRSHETSQLINRMSSSADPLSVLKEFQKEHNTDGGAN
ncbi:MAG: hypothetical protein GY833_22350 [Aestuariibacter sp.]|nr:hypothetical protein [Aestuariibacter sp.]|tara:strand:- start:2292 stop:4289 length:1998 start_codon:yes stop_codon:yes gene_type:complete